jgi:hypothetical protein
MGAFAEECLFIPTKVLKDIAIDAGERFELKFHPESRERTRLDPYRQRLSELGALVSGITAPS